MDLKGIYDSVRNAIALNYGSSYGSDEIRMIVVMRNLDTGRQIVHLTCPASKVGDHIYEHLSSLPVKYRVDLDTVRGWDGVVPGLYQSFIWVGIHWEARPEWVVPRRV
jgi:hypothetical protein